jgi:hypothetical protein
MHSLTLFGPLRMLPTRPIESLEEGRLERVHSGRRPGEGSVIWTGSIVALFTRGAMGPCSYSKCDL